jgi:hypothetical protein
MTPKQEKLIENYIRTKVKSMLFETTWAPVIEDNLKTVERYTEWILDPNRKNTDKDLDKYIELIQKSLTNLINARKHTKLG